MRYVLGLDLGQTTDYTALAVGSYIAGDRKALDVVYLERLPLGTSYPDQVARVEDVLRRDPLRGRCRLVVDSTGVGRPVTDMFRERNLEPVEVTITSGSRSVETEPDEWSVAKQNLVGAVQVALQNQALRIADGLPEVETLRDELAAYQMRVTDHSNLQFDAVSGSHDDLVTAVALCCWWVETQPERPALW